jgi:lipopolysaccharide assembly protein B
MGDSTLSALADTARAVTETSRGGISPALLIVILAGLLILVLIIIIFASRSGRRKGPSSASNYQRALRALLDGNDVEAIRAFRDTVMQDTDNVDAYIRLGRLIRERGDAEKAAGIHQSLTARPSLSKDEEIRIYEELLEDYRVLERTEKTIALLKEIIKLSPKKLEYLKRLLALLIGLSHYDEALSVVKDYRKIFPDKKDTAVWYAEIARRKLEKGDQNAADILKQAQTINKNHPYVMIVQVHAFMNQNLKSKAKQILERFYKLYPQHANHVLDLTEKVYFETGTYDKILPLYQKLLEHDSKNDQIRLRIIKLWFKQGSPRKSLDMIQSALAENPGDIALLLEKIKLQLAEKNLDGVKESFSHLENAIVLMPQFCESCGCELNPAYWFCPQCGKQVGAL